MIQKNKVFSLMKGIAIISVVIGYCADSRHYLDCFVNQYHLAVFFFVAGYFFKENNVECAKTFISKRIKSLYIPFVLAGIGFLLLHKPLAWLNIYNPPITSITESFKALFDLCVRMVSTDPLLGAMWFCPALLWVSLIGVFAFKLSNLFLLKQRLGNVYSKVFVFASLILIASIALHLLHLKSPYCIWQNIITSGIFLEGWIFKNIIEDKLPKLSKGIFLTIAVLLGIILYGFMKIGLLAHLQPGNINNESSVVILVIAFIGSIMVYCFSKSLVDSIFSKPIMLCGDHSFSIMLLHFLSFKLINYVQCIVYGYQFTHIADFPVIRYTDISWFWGYVISGSMLPLIMVYIYSKTKLIFNNMIGAPMKRFI